MNTHAEYRRHSYRPAEPPPATEPAASERARHRDPSLATATPGSTRDTKGITWVRPTELASHAGPLVGRSVELQVELMRRARRTPGDNTSGDRKPRPGGRPAARSVKPSGRTSAVTTSFKTAKGLRRLLVRLRVSGPHAWEQDPEARDLMAFAALKYRALSLKHRCDPSAGAAAAFEAMRTYAVRTAEDPWAVVTMAVKVSLIAEERANGLLCSVDQARRPEFSQRHDVRRFCDTEADLPNFLPAHCRAVQPSRAAPDPRVRGGRRDDRPVHGIGVATRYRHLRCGLHRLPPRRVREPRETHAALRRDYSAQALLDIDQEAWSTVLRIILGNPNPDEFCTADGHGILLRLLIGDPVSELLDDDLLLFEIHETAPHVDLPPEPAQKDNEADQDDQETAEVEAHA